MASHGCGGITLPFAPIIVGAGVCKKPANTKEWLKVAPVVSGSYTPSPRDGNKGDKLFYPDTETELHSVGFGLNSFGMPNMGFSAAAQEFDDYDGVQPLIISVAGFCIDDYIIGVEEFSRLKNVNAIELNFGCPNTEHGKIMSFNPRALDALFFRLIDIAKKPIWVKFSPYSDPGLLKEVAEVVNEASSVVKAVVTCNTFASAYAGKDAISPMDGLAGLSGPALKPIAMGQVKQFRKYLSAGIYVVGVGGIITGNDVVDFLDAGADAVQMTSLPFWLGTPSRFWETLLHEDTGNRLNKYLD